MKNNSVKFKMNVPKSSTTSVITEFSCDASPMPNGFQFSSFTHAQSISARLTKNSVYNTQNIAFNTPRCMNVPYNMLIKDEVLSKSPLSRMHQQGNPDWKMRMEPVTFSDAVNKELKYTEQSLKRIKRMERFIQDHQKNGQQMNILSSEETPKTTLNRLNFMELEQKPEQQQTPEEDIKPKVNKKFNALMEDLRIIRKNIEYFTPFDGAFSDNHKSYNNQVALKSGNGVLVNNGSFLTKIQLIGDTFKVDRVCDNPEKKSDYTSYCVTDKYVCDDMILTGNSNGSLVAWDLQKHCSYEYYALNQGFYGKLKHECKPSFITQHLQNIYVGTQDNQLLVLDHRLKEKNCLSFSKTTQKLFKANSVQQSPLVPKLNHSFSLDSPQVNPINVDDLRETNFRLDDEPENECIELEIPQFQQRPRESQGIRFVDVIDFQVLATMPNGLIHFDMRNPLQEQFSYIEEEGNSVKALFTPNTPDNIIYTQSHSNKCLFWNIQKNELLFEKQLISNPIDMIVSPKTKEIITLHSSDQGSQISVYNNYHSKMKYIDEINVSQFDIHHLLLDQNCECLYGIGPYSLRTWNYYKQQEIDLIQQEMQHQLDLII